MPASPEQQADWVRLFRESGANQYFEKLYVETRRAIFVRCFRILRDESRAEDATHETFLRAYVRFGDFRGHNFLAWAGSIASNICLNRLRSTRIRQRLEPELKMQGTAPPPPDGELERKRQVRRAENVLTTLGPEQRKVLLLKYLEGYSYAEIYELTGYDSEKVRSLLQNGKRNFRLTWKRMKTDESFS